MAKLAGRRDSAAHERAQFLAQRQAETGSAVFGRRTTIGLAEVLEQATHIRLGNTDSGILHLNFDPVPGLPLPAMDGECDCSFLSELRSIAHQI